MTGKSIWVAANRLLLLVVLFEPNILGYEGFIMNSQILTVSVALESLT